MPSKKKKPDEVARPPNDEGAKPPDDQGGDYGEGGGPPDDERPVGPGNPDADPVTIHEAFVERRIGGGRPATPEAYEEALRQWRRLPGAVRAPSTEVTGDETPPASEERGEPDQDERSDEERPR
jgi:hypothetical protein